MSANPLARHKTMENVQLAIQAAEKILPGQAAPADAEDPRWQAIIEVSEFLETDPAPIWSFVQRWGSYPDDDLSDAIATCVLEHLLELHFDAYFSKVVEAAHSNPQFARTVEMCAAFGLTEEPGNFERFEKLKDDLRGRAS